MANWEEIAGNSVLLPSQPKGIIHFLGGAFVATAPQVTYSWLLESLAEEGYAIIATPFLNDLNHSAIAQRALNRFETAYQRSGLFRRYLPIYGLGHSMGCKLHLLINSLYEVQRSGNLLISYNNYPARKSVPLVEQLNNLVEFDLEFTPSPERTYEILRSDYKPARTLLVQFQNDTIDQTEQLKPILEQHSPSLISYLQLSGNHLTPVNPKEWNWNPGSSFSPLDALGQWFKQQFYRDIEQLKKEVLRWLDPIVV
ncbi:DUF1350 domain-containing protein [Euhalothece natronophila Z-M001]|uniref:DUF1350 domain-containing protein n=1 Tax=Euhalothece natronophila Z-M001 TaxID=522448 RepID=A0A5B8NI92_9CHRO|nr:DUF1350 family protein [Euhalothece natronophila]QDZ38627.1 DUF1350 domain-containing protein [Euhalothece natronophila Z-M001]